MINALFNEYVDVVNRKEILEKCPLNEQERFEFLNAFLNCCQWNKIYFTWRPNLKDEGDNHIKALASQGNRKRGLELLKKLQDYYEDELENSKKRFK